VRDFFSYLIRTDFEMLMLFRGKCCLDGRTKSLIDEIAVIVGEMRQLMLNLSGSSAKVENVKLFRGFNVVRWFANDFVMKAKACELARLARQLQPSSSGGPASSRNTSRGDVKRGECDTDLAQASSVFGSGCGNEKGGVEDAMRGDSGEGKCECGEKVAEVFSRGERDGSGVDDDQVDRARVSFRGIKCGELSPMSSQGLHKFRGSHVDSQDRRNGRRWSTTGQGHFQHVRRVTWQRRTLWWREVRWPRPVAAHRKGYLLARSSNFAQVALPYSGRALE
jgi:hypothetical protein